MALYAWDLGFHFDHDKKYDGTCDLQIGLCDVAKNRPGSPFGLKSGDKIAFSAYDLTASSTSKPEVLLFLVEFAAANSAQGDFSPLQGEAVVFQPAIAYVSNTNSLFFGPRAHGFQAPLADKEKYYYTIKPMQGSSRSYEMTVTLIVKKEVSANKFEYRKFIVDPEMIIDSQ
jgi:hypothetical protein